MTTDFQMSRALRQAVQWISARLKSDDHPPLQKLLQQAVFRFDLNPADAEFLQRFYHNSADSSS
ncbi:MAG: hypothetical protein WAN36_07245 [Calditrichia bacterium]